MNHIIKKALGEKYETIGATETALITSFITAHHRCHGSPSLEIGSDDGKNARMLLEIMEGLYRGEKSVPVLHTVDPYGDKPYLLGDRTTGLLYGDRTYTEMKHRLASFPNHVHWCMEAAEFLSCVAGKVKIWRNGGSQYLNGFAFAFVDGDHRSEAIYAEVSMLSQLMNRRGLIVVDNTDWDDKTHRSLERFRPTYVTGRNLCEIAVIDMEKIG